MIRKEIKYNLHYDNVRGDILRPPHGTTPATFSTSNILDNLILPDRTASLDLLTRYHFFG